MKATKFKIGFEKTINLGNYENIKPNIEVEFELEPGETLNESFNKAYTAIKKDFEQKCKLIEQEYNA